jgi:hypothetical protein
VVPVLVAAEPVVPVVLATELVVPLVVPVAPPSLEELLVVPADPAPVVPPLVLVDPLVAVGLLVAEPLAPVVPPVDDVSDPVPVLGDVSSELQAPNHAATASVAP